MLKSWLGIVIAGGLAVITAGPAAAQLAPAANAVPLADVLALAKPYPNLLFEVRAELVRAGLKRDAVSCGAHRFGSDWRQLGGVTSAPYECRIGQRTLVVSARQTFFDANGHKLSADSPQARDRAKRITEAGLKWRWL